MSLDEVIDELEDIPAPEYVDGRPTATHAECVMMEAARWLRKFRTEQEKAP